jgi:uncharacterized Zn-finger protein
MIVPQLTVVADTESEAIECSGNCHARRHPKVLLEHVKE